jgi:hypothetical protein
MRRRSFWNTCYLISGWVIGFATLVLVASGLCARLKEPSSLLAKPVIGAIVAWFKPTAEWMVIALPILIPIVEKSRKKMGTPWVWDCVQSLINDFEGRLFRAKDLRRDEHAATLFKLVKWRWWPWPRIEPRLVAVARSGNARRRSTSTFRVSDSGGTRSEGVCGQVFSRETVLSAYNLPDLIENADDECIRKYAVATCVSEEWLRKWVERKRTNGQKLPRSYCGFHVETSSGKPWGVLLLDSTSPDDLQVRAEKIYDVAKKQLSRMVERI